MVKPRDDVLYKTPQDDVSLRQNRAFHLPEADAEAISGAASGDRDAIAVIKEGSFFMVLQFNGLGAIPAQFDEGAKFTGRRTTNRSGR